ncbi:MAG: hypothetical protein NVS3B28_17940 [Candidatus Velthaea sp.]
MAVSSLKSPLTGLRVLEGHIAAAPFAGDIRDVARELSTRYGAIDRAS